ncbi:choline transporter-like protein 1 [Penaeus monodon]|uniref:choline transporter-like protein 1 n=1 Tax=Penaeus monodon TaxID=6687 RepID=UPI0018A74A8F|nr:choline transporter-like protein 1 [Penaeus monodon]
MMDMALEVDPVNIATGNKDAGVSSTSTCVAECPKDRSTAFGFYCLPLSLSDAANTTDKVLTALTGTSGTDFFKNVGRDLRSSWREIIYMCLVALGLSIVVTAMLRFLAPVIVWITVVLITVASVAVTVFLWVSWHLRKQAVERAENSSGNNNDTLSGYEKDVLRGSVNNFLIMAIVSTIFTVLTIVLLIAMRNRIKLVIALFKEAGKAIAAMPMILLQPVWTCVWLVLVCLLGVIGVLLIESSGDPKLYQGTVLFVKSSLIANLRWYHLFALLWITQFLVACQHVTIAGSISQWYFTRNKNKLGWPILTSMKRMYRYHLGSIALGSLIIALVKLVRIVLKASVKRRIHYVSKLVSWALKCCQCCLWCFEKFLKFLSKNAYIEIAIYGYGFCKAAQKAFSLLVNNAFRVAAINYVGAFVLFLSKATIVISSVFICIKIILFPRQTRKDVTYAWVPVLIAAVFSYFIAHCFISVYEMTIDTLFLCFCEDCERNDGIEKPYYMSKGLMQFVENSKKALAALEANQPQGKVWTTNVQPQNGFTSTHYPVAAPLPEHAHGEMTTLYPPYPPNSMPPSPSRFITPAG